MSAMRRLAAWTHTHTHTRTHTHIHTHTHAHTHTHTHTQTHTHTRTHIHTHTHKQTNIHSWLFVLDYDRILEKPDFSVTYGEPFEIKMAHSPEIITLQVESNIHMYDNFTFCVYTYSIKWSFYYYKPTVVVKKLTFVIVITLLLQIVCITIWLLVTITHA